MASTTRRSREHVDAYLARERRDLERLRASVGFEPVAKLDQVLRRDLLAERRLPRAHEADEREVAV